jgi:hypothetical protein
MGKLGARDRAQARVIPHQAVVVTLKAPPPAFA